jgi:hypothetical protein
MATTHTVFNRSGYRCTVPTAAAAGLYAVHKAADWNGHFLVTHRPSGLTFGITRTLRSARALAAHLDAVAGDAGSAWGLGARFDQRSEDGARIQAAINTRPALDL